jgi:hypothetical protein
MIATLPRSLPLLQFQHSGPLQQFDLAVEVDAGIDAPMPIPLGRNVGLRLFVTAPRLDDVSIKLVVHARSSTLVGHSFRKRVRNGERKSVPPRF